MKKLLLLVFEINGLVFAWYVFMGLAIVGIDAVTGGFLARMGVARTAIYWIVGTSAALEAARGFFPRLKKAPKVLREKTALLARDFFSFALVAACVAWGAGQYENSIAMADLAEAGGLPRAGAVAGMAAVFFIGALMNGKEETEEGCGKEDGAEHIKKTYAGREESSIESGKKNAFLLWRYAHETEYESIVRHVPAGATVLDNGCGDGTLAILLAKKGAKVTACDISPLNVAKAEGHAAKAGMGNAVTFMAADAENLPFTDGSFDWVVSSHVLEHLPHFEKGLSEVRRVTKRNAIVALPTCLNPCAAVILGGDVFWRLSRRSPFAWFVGIGRIVLGIGGTGIDEGYRGDGSLPHVWRYPHVMRRELRAGGFEIIRFEASSFCFPYFTRLVPLAKKLEKYKSAPFLRDCGYGSIAVMEKIR